MSRAEAAVSETSLTSVVEKAAVVEPVKKIARRRAKSAAKKVVSRVKTKSSSPGDTPVSKGADRPLSSKELTFSQSEINADELFLNAVRDKSLEKLNRGEMELKIADGLRAVELKNKICGGTDYQGVLKELLEEIRKEALGHM